jgi:tripartite-type tricarboxylate transporter receptor subunit TctC
VAVGARNHEARQSAPRQLGAQRGDARPACRALGAIFERLEAGLEHGGTLLSGMRRGNPLHGTELRPDRDWHGVCMAWGCRLKFLFKGPVMLKNLARAFFAACLLCNTAANAGWPDRPVTVIVPYAAGGITDILARLTVEHLQRTFKQSFIIQNESGAGGIIGAANAARAKPDGYTLFFAPIALLTLSPLTTKVTFATSDFEPISIVASSPFVVTVGKDFPANSISEFIAEVKKKPGGYTYASAGLGSATHVASLLFLKSAGLDMVHAPYRGVGPAFTDLVAGQVQMLSASPVELKPFIGSDKVRPLAISSKQRSKYLPDVPAIIETLPSPFVATYNGLMAPQHTPKEIIDIISAEIVAAEKTPEFLEKLSKVGVEPMGTTPQEMAEEIVADTQRWRAVANDVAPKGQ